MLLENDFHKIEWQDEACSDLEKAVGLTAQILSDVRSGGVQPARVKKLLELFHAHKAGKDDPVKHAVNQGMRALINHIVIVEGRDDIGFQIVYEVCQQFLFSTTKKLEKSLRDEAEDVLQNSWLHAREKLDHFQQCVSELEEGVPLGSIQLNGILNPLKGDFLAWFSIVVNNKFLDFLKGQGRRETRITCRDFSIDLDDTKDRERGDYEEEEDGGDYEEKDGKDF